MIVSWNWLTQYVPLGMPLEELQRRLMMSGLNHEGTEEVGGDLAIELEVTSNRPDCLGHIGVAREVAVLWGSRLRIPAAQPPEGKTPAGELVAVRIDCPDLCPRYTAWPPWASPRSTTWWTSATTC
jgi:phenylalanyl-tRNA synthetase beta chain